MPSELRLVKKLELAELTDEDVMERCALGSETAFRALVQRYRSRIMNLVCRFINDRDRAEEISQEVFLRVYRNRERYRKSGKFSTWIFTIAVNLTKNEIRSRVRHKGTFSLDAMEEDSGGQGLAFPDLKPLPDEDLNASEIRRRVAEALEKIPARYREAVVLRDIEGLSYEEVGEILRIPGGTVRSRINRARLMLKERMKPCTRASAPAKGFARPRWSGSASSSCPRGCGPCSWRAPASAPWRSRPSCPPSARASCIRPR